MKKLVVVLAIASVAVSCKKIQAGGNKNTLKLEEGVERYSDDHQGGGEAHGHASEAAHHEGTPNAEHHTAEAPKTDSTAPAAKPSEANTAPAEH